MEYNPRGGRLVPQVVDTRSMPDCSFYLAGNCRNGNACPFKHDPSRVAVKVRPPLNNFALQPVAGPHPAASIACMKLTRCLAYAAPWRCGDSGAGHMHVLQQPHRLSAGQRLQISARCGAEPRAANILELKLSSLM